MSDAVAITCATIENALSKSHAYKKVDEGLYVVRQGSAYVMISVVATNDNDAIVRCLAQLVRGVKLTPALGRKLLTLNARLRLGAFGYVPDGDVITFAHSILGGATMDIEELTATVRDVALLADEFDDRIVAEGGGMRMQDILEEEALRNIQRDLHVGKATWEN